MKSWILWVGIVIWGVSSWAAIPVRQASSEKRNHYLDAGVFVGGHDHGALSLLNLRHSVDAAKVERVVFDVGTPKINDRTAERPGFFHITIQKNPRRVVIDLENVTQSKVSPAQLAQIFQKSPYFSKGTFFSDSEHKNLTIEIPLKVPAQIEVFELSSMGKPGRIVMDVKGPGPAED